VHIAMSRHPWHLDELPSLDNNDWCSKLLAMYLAVLEGCYREPICLVIVTTRSAQAEELVLLSNFATGHVMPTAGMAGRMASHPPQRTG
jgi:hypothetical protein